MAVPKRRVSKTKRNTRRAHDALSVTTISTCPNCGAKVLPHHVCPSCGQYDGKQVVAKKEA
ncbi:MAG: 50S ribosomal protein L32 [Erysipelotrichaceae bacterium]|nr:50S ribosomal protein L32 [Erysipelotrichaceae bacterium]